MRKLNIRISRGCIEINSITFKGINSYYDMNLMIERFPVLPTAERDIDIINIEGRNGYLTHDKKVYKPFDLPIEMFINSDNYMAEARKIKQWFDGTGGRLIISPVPDAFFIVKSVSLSDFEECVEGISKFQAVFRGIVFENLLAGDETITVTNATRLFNPGTYWSEPRLKIYGDGDINLTIENENIMLKGISNYIILDSEMPNAYKEAQNQNNKMYGEFPILEPGNNNISWIGNVQKIEIIPRWRSL